MLLLGHTLFDTSCLPPSMSALGHGARSAFQGESRVSRQRRVYALLQDEFAQGLHALSLSCETPAVVQRAPPPVLEDRGRRRGSAVGRVVPTKFVFPPQDFSNGSRNGPQRLQTCLKLFQVFRHGLFRGRPPGPGQRCAYRGKRHIECECCDFCSVSRVL